VETLTSADTWTVNEQIRQTLTDHARLAIHLTAANLAMRCEIT